MTDSQALLLASQTWSTGDKIFYVVGCLLLMGFLAMFFSGKKE